MSIDLRLADVAAQVGATLRAPPDVRVNGLGTLQNAQPNQLSFLSNARYRPQLASTQAAAVLLTAAEAENFAGHALIVPDPYAAFARLSYVFDPSSRAQAGIHARALVHPSATIHPSASIGAHVVIEQGVVIGANTVIVAGAFIGEYAEVGADCWIGAQVVIHHRCVLGDRVRIHAGTSIGAEGFGFVPHQGHWHRIVQLGRVRIGNDSRLGSHCSVDRGAIDDTIIGQNVIIDNQVHIAHNVQIGDHTAIAACCGIAGSTKIGRHCIFAGKVGVVGHIEIADHVQFTGMTMVTKSISQAGSYSSGTGMSETSAWRKMAVSLRKLPDLPIKALQQQLKHMQAQLERLESRIFDQRP